MFPPKQPVPRPILITFRAYRPLALILLACVVVWLIIGYFWPKGVLYYVAICAGVLTSIQIGFYFDRRAKRYLLDRDWQELRRREELQAAIDDAAREDEDDASSGSEGGEQVPRGRRRHGADPDERRRYPGGRRRP